jgi:hypothetical protein
MNCTKKYKKKMTYHNGWQDWGAKKKNGNVSRRTFNRESQHFLFFLWSVSSAFFVLPLECFFLSDLRDGWIFEKGCTLGGVQLSYIFLRRDNGYNGTVGEDQTWVPTFPSGVVYHNWNWIRRWCSATWSTTWTHRTEVQRKKNQGPPDVVRWWTRVVVW